LEKFKEDSMKDIEKKVSKIVTNSLNTEIIEPISNGNLPDIASHFNKFQKDKKVKNIEKLNVEKKVKEESIKRGFGNALEQMIYDMQKGVPLTNSHKEKLKETHLSLPGMDKGTPG
jgi:Na+-transporting NADH:ubiquinone oxidoreductase subunit NqrC